MKVGKVDVPFGGGVERAEGATHNFVGLLQRKLAPLLTAGVRIEGLKGRVELNGQVGTATLYDEKSGRYGVQLKSEAVRVLPKNLVRCDVEPAGATELD